MVRELRTRGQRFKVRRERFNRNPRGMVVIWNELLEEVVEAQVIWNIWKTFHQVNA